MMQHLTAAITVGWMIAVLELVRRKKLKEEYGLAWLVGLGSVLGLSSYADWLDGVISPFLGLALVFLTAVLLVISVAMSTARARIDRLVEDIAILSAELCDTRSAIQDLPVRIPPVTPSRSDPASGPEAREPNPIKQPLLPTSLWPGQTRQ